MKYVLKEKGKLRVYFHMGELPANVKLLVQAMAPNDAEAGEGHLMTLIPDSGAEFGNRAIYVSEAAKVQYRADKKAENDAKRKAKDSKRKKILKDLEECEATGDLLKVLQYLGIKPIE